VADFIYHIIVIAIMALGILRGFRRKFTGQVPACFGIAFGILCSYLFRFPVEECLYSILPLAPAAPDTYFILSMIGCSLIFFLAYGVFYLCTMLLGMLMKMYETTMLDNIAGAIFGLFRYTLMLSIALNLFLCSFPDCRLLKYAMHDDGDIVHEVMLLSPYLTGSESVDEYAHKVQLEEAKTIS